MAQITSAHKTRRLIIFTGNIFLEPIRRIPDLFHDGQTEHFKSLEARFAVADQEEREWLEDLAADENYLADQLPTLVGELMILATYKTIEIAMLRIITLGYPDIKPDKLYKFDKIRDLIKKKGLDITVLSGYAAVDELRCINNSIKHEGVVNKQLAEIWGVEPGSPLGNLRAHYSRLEMDVEGFTQEFANSVATTVVFQA